MVEETLPNRLKIVFFPLESSLTTALLLFVNFGLRFEDEKTRGLSPFITNLILRGSQKYPDDLSLGQTLDNLGAYFNVEVQKEYLAFYLKVANEKTISAAEFLAEIISRPLFSLSEIEREKKLCQFDLTNRAKNSAAVALDNLLELVYQNHPLVHTGTASKTFLENLRRDDLFNYHQNIFTGANITLVVVGQPEDKAFVSKLKAVFTPIPAGHKNNFKAFDKNSLNPNNRLTDMDTDQIYAAFGYPSYPRNHPRRRVLDLAETILVKGRANRRFLPLYLNRAPASYVTANGQYLSDFGFFLIQLAATAANIKVAYQRTIEEIEKLKTEGIKNEELERVKNIYLGNLLIQTSEPIESGFFYGLQYLTNEGKVLSFAETKKQIEEITSEDIQKAANEIFDQKKIFASLVGKNVTQIR